MITLLEQARDILDQGMLLSVSGNALTLREELKHLNLLTLKPFIYVFNLDEGHLTDPAKHQELRAIAPTENVVFVSAQIEAELSELDDTDAEDIMASYGIAESGLSRLSKVGFETLGLQTFLTTGEKESKAWTIPKGATAPQAAGAIHGDFERGFIAADIVSYDDLVEAKTRTAARAAGKLRTEGKEYVMQDGDVVEFKFNV